MAAFQKFDTFVGDLCIGKKHDCNADTFEVYFTGATPSASAHALTADLPEIATGNGYTGPQDVQNTASESGGVITCVGVDVVVTAGGGTIPDFRYVVLRNGTAAGGPLIGFWDNGVTVSLTEGSSFTTDFGADLFQLS